jgi:hypothetical protein
MDWARKANSPERFGAALCLLPIALLTFSFVQNADVKSASYWDIWFQWLVAIPGILLITILVALPQIGIFAMLLRFKITWLQWTLCIVSAALVALYARFISTNDLTTSSTAPLAAIFYPIYVAIWSLPAVGIISWLAHRMGGGGPTD